jgi:hypothetical protein
MFVFLLFFWLHLPFEEIRTFSCKTRLERENFPVRSIRPTGPFPTLKNFQCWVENRLFQPVRSFWNPETDPTR